MKKLLMATFVVLVMVGCAARRNARIAPLYADDPYWQQYVAKAPSEVLVTEGDLRKKYRPIARIFVDSSGTEKSLSFERMGEEGARIGADAVIKIKVSTQYEGQVTNAVTGQDYGGSNRHLLEGTAVIFN
jgi:hypothetical protein